MVTVGVDELPATLRKLATAAVELGWTAYATEAAGPPATVALRLAHAEHRCYAVWELTTTKAGKAGVKWRGGANNRLAHFPTLAAFKSYVGLA